MLCQRHVNAKCLKFSMFLFTSRCADELNGWKPAKHPRIYCGKRDKFPVERSRERTKMARWKKEKAGTKTGAPERHLSASKYGVLLAAARTTAA